MTIHLRLSSGFANDQHLDAASITRDPALDRAAALTVTEHARDRDDAALLLRALGLDR